tara:strand:+ start:1053 stop:1289 length:237 start_codon:yes stop_codon:yes gene_type:complete
MSLIDKILKDRIFNDILKNTPDDERENVRESIKKMLSPAEDFYFKILDAGSTEEGVERLSKAILPVISPTDTEENVEK